MTGPEHYREAEKHIGWASAAGAGSPHDEAIHLRYAQVHATLAQAAGSALVGDMEEVDLLAVAWREVAS